MKNTILLFISFFFINANLLNSQNKSWVNDAVIQEVPSVEIKDLLFAKIIELKQMGANFKYYDEIEKGKYVTDFSSEKVFLKFINKKSTSYKKLNNSNNFASFSIPSKDLAEVLEFDIYYVDGFKYLKLKDSYKYIDENQFVKELQNALMNNVGSVQHVFRNRIIIDKEICNLSLINNTYPNFGKILNRTVISENTVDHQNNPGDLFANPTAGTMIPLPIGAGSPKLLLVDKNWNRLVMMDRDIVPESNELAKAYPLYPGHYYSLFYPTDIISGKRRVIEYGGGNYRDSIVSLYIADNGNDRIVRLDYHMQYIDFGEGFLYHQSFVQDASFRILLTDVKPNSLDLHKGNNVNDSTDDVLWYTGGFASKKSLICVNAMTGQFIQEIRNIRGININPSRLSIYRSPNGARNILAFIDEESNYLGVLKLETNGSFVNSDFNVRYLENFGIIKLKSVELSSNNNESNEVTIWTAGDGGSGGCYGNTHCGDISTLKINIINNFPVNVEYLATSWVGFNSPSSFVDLQNIYIHNGYLDISTMEDWTDNFGLRKYKPGIDVVSTVISPYCNEAQYCTYKVKLTNPAKVKFSGRFKPSGGQWISQDIFVNNIGPNPTLTLQSGTTDLTISKIGGSNSPIDESELKVIADFIPLDENTFTNNSHKITTEMITTFTNCISPGGCPYLFVYNGTEYIQDNNILHRSEFENNLGIDIEDKYLLRVNPFMNVSDSTYLIKIRELNNDISNFDKFSLVTIDHPTGTNLGITENNEYVLYFPTIACVLNYAEHDGVNVTPELQYDTNYAKTICGDEDDNVTGTFDDSGSDELRKVSKKTLLSKIKDISHLRKPKNFRNNNSKVYGDSWILDSIAILIDPGVCDALITPGPPAKKPAGTITGYDASNEYVSPEIDFAQRQNASPVVIVVGSDVNIDSVVSLWSISFSISFLTVIPVYYGGYIENDLDLVEATDSLNGNVLGSLTDIDQNYSTMDSTTNISLKFRNAFGEVPSGFVRDFILVTTGRYENVSDGENLLLNGDEKTVIPKSYELHQNFPNPFNPNTTIKFDIPKEGLVTIKVYDILGREVYLFNEMKQPGVHQLIFNGSNFASGIYFYRIESGNFVQTRRMVLLK